MKLQTKLALWYALLTLFLVGALFFVILRVSGSAARITAASTLETAVKDNANGLEYGKGRLREMNFHTYDDGAYLLVYSADGATHLAGADVFSADALIPEILTEHEPNRMFYTSIGDTWVYGYFLWLPEDTGRAGTVKPVYAGSPEASSGDMAAGGVWVIGFLPEDSMEDVMGSVVRMAYIVLPCIVLLAALGGWLIAGRSLRPLRKITKSAREISDGHDLSRRIEIGSGKDEVHELADTFNGMMGRLERSFDAERQFTSDASHELRTPTAIILAECEMAEKTPEDAAALSESVEVVHRQARKMSDLIGKLLSYTRLEQGTRKVDLEPLDLSELTETICADQQAVAARGITITHDITPGVTVNGDAALLISLVQNLVSNAVKYGRENGHVRVKVYTQAESACVSVADDGVGISADDLPNIFNRFYQADRSRNNADGGLGLGLSLAQQIARLHGGVITAASEPGQGSEFLFTMPRHSAAK